MQHTMKLTAGAFHLVASGKKTIEVRVNDSKRQNLSAGDEIVFAKLPERKQTIVTTITDLHIFPDFLSLYRAFPSEVFGARGWTAEQLAENVRRYYSQEEEKKYGVVGIELSAELSIGSRTQ